MKNAEHRWFDSKYVQHTLGGLDCFPVYMQVWFGAVRCGAVWEIAVVLTIIPSLFFSNGVDLMNDYIVVW